MRYKCEPGTIPKIQEKGIISVIIPCYNAEKFIGRCLDSVIAQTIGLDYLEIIIVNDCSTDNTLEEINKYEQQYPQNICVINLDENVGLGQARNIGLTYTNGEYITFVDADDAVSKNMLEELYLTANYFKCDYVDCEFEQFYEKIPDDPEDDGIKYLDVIENLDERRAFFLNNAFINAAWMRLFSRDFLVGNELLRFPPRTFMEDIYFFYLVIAKAKVVGHVPKKMYFYYQNPEGIMLSDRFNNYYMDIHNVFAKAVEKYKELGIFEDFKEELAYAYYQKVFRYIVDYSKKEFGKVDTRNYETLSNYMSGLTSDIHENKYYVLYGNKE